MIERSHRAFIRAAFDGMIGAITTQVDAFIRDLHLIVAEEGIDNSTRTAGSGSSTGVSLPGMPTTPAIATSGSLRRGSHDDDEEDGEAKEAPHPKRTEAEKYAEFALRLRARLAIAEGRIAESREVVGMVREMGMERVD